MIKPLLLDETGQGILGALKDVANAIAVQNATSLDNVATRVIVEESSNPNWSRFGNLTAIDTILGRYGSYVIDEAHKKYALLSGSDHSKFADGTAWAGTWGDAFRRLPKVYYKVEKNEEGQNVLSISLLPISDLYFDETWTGVYKGFVDESGKLRSQPNRKAAHSKDMSTFHQHAQNLGKDYGLADYFFQQKIIALHLAKFGCADSTQTMGKGLQDAGWNTDYYQPMTGCTAGLGNGTGSADYMGGHKQNKLFGMEGLAGSQWEFRPNIRFEGTKAIVYDGNIVSNTAPGREFQRDADLNFSGTYFSKIALGEHFDIIPVAGGGSASTYWCDGAWSAPGGQLLIVGGASGDGSGCGLSAASSNSGFSYSGGDVGARLAYKGHLSGYSLVSGAELANLNG